MGCRTTQDLRILGNKDILGKPQNCISLVLSFSCKNILLGLALKKCAKTDSKGLRLCLTLLVFLIFLKIFYTRLLAEKAFTK